MSRQPEAPRRAVLDALQTPRTMPDLLAALPDVSPRQVQNTVYNAVTRGHATNLRASEGRKCGGLFVAMQPDVPMRAQFDGLLGAWK